jgi:uncharacterized SAM-binding protein YcdF (DUF218 family)
MQDRDTADFSMVRRRKRGGLGGTLLFGLLGLAIFFLIVGFFSFADGIPRAETKLDRSADGIVVLTGAPSRIEDAIELLAAKRGERLLISGVHPQTKEDELTHRSPEVARLFACCVELDREATNTTGNALAAAAWARKWNFRSLIVVTSAWHMPRALIELSREMPHVTLIPHSVVTERMRDEPWWSNSHTARVLFVEYVKYVAAVVRQGLDPIAAGAQRLSQRTY